MGRKVTTDAVTNHFAEISIECLQSCHVLNSLPSNLPYDIAGIVIAL